MRPDLIRRFHLALPAVRSWIDQYIEAHAPEARKVSTLGFSRLGLAYPHELLERTKVVTVDRVPFPPVDQFDLPEFATLQNMQFDGITFKDTFFLLRGCESESLHFHELVHVIQWARLGVDNFLLAYGLGLIQAGYANSPLEAMAFALQGLFDRGALPTDVVQTIEQHTDVIWSTAAPIVRG
jgi:hypothetical protein